LYRAGVSSKFSSKCRGKAEGRTGPEGLAKFPRKEPKEGEEKSKTKKGRKYPCTPPGEQEPEALRNEDSLVSQNNKSIRNKNTLDQNCHESEKGLALDAGAGDKTVHIYSSLAWPNSLAPGRKRPFPCAYDPQQPWLGSLAVSRAEICSLGLDDLLGGSSQDGRKWGW